MKEEVDHGEEVPRLLSKMAVQKKSPESWSCHSPIPPKSKPSCRVAGLLEKGTLLSPGDLMLKALSSVVVAILIDLVG
jgi:hypothetical protein